VSASNEPAPPLRAVLVDDEPLSRRRLRELLDTEPDVQVVGEYGDAREAVTGIAELAPDLLFLDIEMPELDGFALLSHLADARPPVVVFVTAFQQYAVRAFEVHAFDYLLKPFGRERLYETLENARRTLRRGREASLSDRLAALVADLRAGEGRYTDRLLVKTGGRFVFVKTDQIDWVETAGNYLRIHCGAEEHLIRETMAGLEERLDPARFARIHRFTLVNVDRVKQVEPYFHGDYVVTLQNGKELTLSAGYRDRLLEKPRRS
jgi:two-component system, LytTR family, response regulator